MLSGLFAFSSCGYDKEVCYEHVTLLASIMLLAWAALIGGDLSTQHSYVNAKWIIKSWTYVGLSVSSLQCILCTDTQIMQRNTYIIYTFDQWKHNHLSGSCNHLNVLKNSLVKRKD